MFERIKMALSGKQEEPVNSSGSSEHDFSDRPVTGALVRRARTYQSEAEYDLREMLGSLRTISRPDSIEDETASCAATIAYHVTTEALNRLGRSAAFLPLEPLPKDGAMIVTFSFFVLAGIHGQLKAEEIELDFQELAANTASLFFTVRPVEEKAKYIKKSFDMFRMVVGADSGKIKEWHDNLMALIPLYILQWIENDEKLRRIDFIDLFSKMLSSLLVIHRGNIG